MPPRDYEKPFALNMKNSDYLNTVGAVLGRINGLFQSLEHVVLEILSLLNTTADSHKVIKDADGLSLVLGDTSVGHAAGQLDQALNTSQTLGEGEDLGQLAEALSSGVSAADAEGQHTTAHTITVLLESDVAVGVRVQTGVVDGNNVGRGLKGLSNGGSVAGSLTGTQVQGLQTTVGQPGVESRGNSANCVLQEAETGLELVAVEGGDTHDDIAVAVDVLGDAVDDNVGAQVERVLNVGGQEGVVDDDEDTTLVGLGDDGADVDEAQGRVARTLDPDEAGVVGDVLTNVDLDLGGEGHLDAVGLGDLGEVTVSATVDVGHGDDMAAGGKALEDDSSGGATAGEGEGVAGVLEGSDGGLEVVSVRVGGSRVLKLADGLANGRLGKGGGEGDGLDDSAGGGIVGRAGVDGQGTKAVDGGRRARRSLDDFRDN